MVQKQYGKKRGKSVVKMEEEIELKEDDEKMRSCSVAYCEGWYVILNRGSGYECFLWNPTSRQKFGLPCLKNHLSFFSEKSIIFSKCVMSSPPTNARCTVLFFTAENHCVLYCKLRDRQWVQETYSHKKHIDVIAFNRKVYAINMRRQIFQIVLGGKLLKYEPFEIEMPFLYPHVLQFVESCEELFVVMMLSKLNLEVFRIDFILKKLVKIDSLGDRIFFLCDSYSSSISGKELGITGNRIYFTRDSNQNLYVLDFEHATLSFTPNRPDSSTIWFSHDGLMPMLRISDDPIYKEHEFVEESKSIEVDESVDTEESVWLKLPIHLQQSIAQRLSQGRDYMNFRGVCRGWRSLAPPCRWHSDRSTTLQHPWLMFIGNEDGICNFYDPWDNVTYSMNNSGLSKDCVIRFSKDGWLFVSQGSRSVFLYEPFAKRRIQLPDLPMDYCFSGVCFSAPPTNSSSSTIVVGVSQICSEWLRICYLDASSIAWNEVDFHNDDFVPSWNNPVFLNGSFYLLDWDGRLGVFELTEETETVHTWKILSNPEPIRSEAIMWANFLMSFEEELFSVFLGRAAGELVKVFRLNLQGGDWVELNSLENQILFISNTTSLAVMPHEERMKNKIYTPNFSNIDNHNVFYSLESQRYDTFGGEYNSTQKFYGTRQQLHSTWIQPRLVPTTWDDM